MGGGVGVGVVGAVVLVLVLVFVVIVVVFSITSGAALAAQLLVEVVEGMGGGQLASPATCSRSKHNA